MVFGCADPMIPSTTAFLVVEEDLFLPSPAEEQRTWFAPTCYFHDASELTSDNPKSQVKPPNAFVQLL